MKYLKKLGFNLFIIGAEIMLLISLIALFTHRWTPIYSVFSVIIWVVLIVISLNLGKKRFYGRPTLSSTTVAILVILILSTFAGVQPMASMKDNAINYIVSKSESVSYAPIENKSIIGKWKQVAGNKPSIETPTIQFMRNGVVIVDDGKLILTGSYSKLSDEYLNINIDSSFFGVQFTELTTMKYLIKNDVLTLRSGSRISSYKRIVE